MLCCKCGGVWLMEQPRAAFESMWQRQLYICWLAHSAISWKTRGECNAAHEHMQPESSFTFGIILWYMGETRTRATENAGVSSPHHPRYGIASGAQEKQVINLAISLRPYPLKAEKKHTALDPPDARERQFRRYYVSKFGRGLIR